MPERILYQFCGPGDMPGGVPDSTNSIAGYMREQGLDPHVIIGSSEDIEQTRKFFSSFVDPDTYHILSNTNHITEANGSQNSLGSPINPWRINKAMWKAHPDILHINAPWMPHIGGIALRFARLYDIPTVATYHIVSDKFVTNTALKLSARVDSKSIQSLDAMIAVSQPGADHMDMTYRYKGDVHIIPNGVDIETLEQSKPFEQDEPFKGYDPSRPTIVFVGRPDPRKGLGELMRTLELVHEEMQDAQLIVCGGKNGQDEVNSDESLAEYITLAKHLGIDRATHFMGRVSDEDKGRWYASADVAALPATGCESQGIVLLEAMAAGAGVVIGGNNDGYASVFNPNDVRSSDLMLVDPFDHHSFKERLTTVLTCNRLARELHNEQQLLVRHKYDIQIVGRQILDLYRSLR